MEEFNRLHRMVLDAVRDDALCRRFMTIPGVGALTVLASGQIGISNRKKWVSTTIRRARIGSRMACQADERTGNLSELPRSKAEIQGWFAGIALARSRIDAAA